MTAATITVPGKVCTDHRARVTRNGTFQPKEYREYMRGVRLHGLAQRPAGWLLDGRYRVTIELHEPDARSRDLDNASKGPLDGLRGVLWADDRQIDRLEVVRGEVRRGRPCVVVHVERVA